MVLSALILLSLSSVPSQELHAKCTTYLGNLNRLMEHKNRERMMAHYADYIFGQDERRYQRIHRDDADLRIEEIPSLGDWAEAKIRTLGPDFAVPRFPKIKVRVPHLTHRNKSTTVHRVSVESIDARKRIETFSNLIRALQLPLQRPLRWVDLGAGHGMALQEALKDPALGPRIVKLMAVDKFDYRDPDFDKRIPYIVSDASIAKLGRPDLITIVELSQYVPDKLKLLAHAYNELEDHGVVLLLAEDSPMEWIRYRLARTKRKLPEEFFIELQKHHIEFAISFKGYRDFDISWDSQGVMIRKKPGTRMIVKTPLIDIWENPEGYLASYYDLTRGSPIRITESP